MENVEESGVLRAYCCGCRKCSVKLNWGGEIITTSSPQVAAGFYRAIRKDLRFSKIHLALWANEASTRTQDKVNAIKAFHMCPIILGFLNQYQDWQKAVEIVKEEVKEPQKILVLVQNWNGQRQSIELYYNAFIGTLRSKMLEVFGDGYNANKAIYFGTQRLEYLKSLDFYSIVHGSILKVQ
ncbi:unnamed protein product [Caenorhabditis angaria]|uniref:Uncharacterized protein n=1 Tax=Caenorhabditis angaria TaxID=860376 RepID=A0A9P1IZ97_9PELO|nr:unnamed protein product [Caenorhabditis angaria]